MMGKKGVGVAGAGWGAPIHAAPPPLVSVWGSPEEASLELLGVGREGSEGGGRGQSPSTLGWVVSATSTWRVGGGGSGWGSSAAPF